MPPARRTAAARIVRCRGARRSSSHERDHDEHGEPGTAGLEEGEVGAVEVEPDVAAASAPASSAGRKGRMPMAAARPRPWRMSRKRAFMACVYQGRMTTRRGAATIDATPPTVAAHGPRALRRAVRLAHARHEVSAMRDLMAITERPDVISLAGGLPDTARSRPRTSRR